MRDQISVRAKLRIWKLASRAAFGLSSRDHMREGEEAI